MKSKKNKKIYYRISTPFEIWFCNVEELKNNIEIWVEKCDRVTVREILLTKQRFEELTDELH